MKIAILAVAMSIFATASHADLKGFVGGPMPQKLDSVQLEEGMGCSNILSIKGWIKFEHPNTIYKEMAWGALWVKGDKMAHCYFRSIDVYLKSDIDNYVDRVTRSRIESQKERQKTLEEGLNRL